MKKNIFILPLLLFIFFCGCRKDHEIKMSGYLYDPNTNERLSGVHFDFVIESEGKSAAGTDTKAGGEATTDANGNYELMFDDAEKRSEKNKHYVGHVTGHSYGSTFDITPDFSDKNSMAENIPVQWKGPLHVIFSNVNPYDANDVITGIYFTQTDEFSTGNISVAGIITNDTIFSHAPTGVTILHSSVTKNNITTQRSDTITVHAIADTYYHLNY